MSGAVWRSATDTAVADEVARAKALHERLVARALAMAGHKRTL